MLRTASLLLICSSLLFSCNRPKLLWTFMTSAPVYGSPAVAKDRLIVGSNDHCLYALALSNGKQIWKTNLGDRVIADPIIDERYAYVGTMGGRFFAVNLQDGRIVWNFKADGGIEFDACADKDSIYFGSAGQTFYRLAKDGKKIWDYPAGYYFTSDCVFYKNLVITSSWDTNFYAFDRSNGKAVWKVSTGLFNYGGPALSGDNVFFGTHTLLYRIEAGTGKVLSKEKLTYLDWVTAYDGFLWTNEFGVTKRSAENGKVLDNIRFEPGGTFKPIGVNGYIIQATARQSLYAISKEMKILWKFKGEDDFWSCGTIHNNVYYNGNRSGRIYALQLPE